MRGMQFKRRVDVAEQPVNDGANQDDDTLRPVTLRIQRKGDEFHTWYSVDGTNFTEVGSGETINNFVKVPWVGLAFSGHGEGDYSTVVFDNFTITSP
jgi:hypothetical protein